MVLGLGNMSDDLLLQKMEEVAVSKQISNTFSTKDSPLKVVLAEIPLTSTELHKIANGKCCQLNDINSQFGIRFMLANSFKIKGTNFVKNNFVAQVVAMDKGNRFRKENLATQTKMVARDKKKGKEKVEVTVESAEESLF